MCGPSMSPSHTVTNNNGGRLAPPPHYRTAAVTAASDFMLISSPSRVLGFLVVYMYLKFWAIPDETKVNLLVCIITSK